MRFRYDLLDLVCRLNYGEDCAWLGGRESGGWRKSGLLGVRANVVRLVGHSGTNK
jgi:hypothetical protein